jgi:MOSC domain-containing protein YiiM
MTGRLVQLNISPGGMPKLPVKSAFVSRNGVEGDWQLNRKYHGGPDRAICLFSEELYARLREMGIDVYNGQVGENFTTTGIDLDKLKIGDRLRVGTCTIEITKVRTPCRSLHQWNQNLMQAMIGHSGWVAKVIEEGWVESGDEIEVMERTEKDVMAGG